MSSPPEAANVWTVADFCRVIEAIAPPALAQSWDNVGLLAGDMDARVRRVTLCVDLTPTVVDEAIHEKVDLVLAYHPPIFKPVSSLRVPSPETDAAVFRCIRHGIAIYATHTACDAAAGGTNDVLASLCGVRQTEPIEYVDDPSKSQVKLVVFVPPLEVERVAEAMFAAGAGRIGDYRRCSYRLMGQGTFFGGEGTSPAVGERGRTEYMDEIRLETIVSAKALPAVVAAMIRTHSYEEPAFDLYPLRPPPARGTGRYGRLRRRTTLGKLARRLKRVTKANGVRTVGPLEREVDRAIILVGAAGTVPFRLPLVPTDVIVTGEIRHHDALTIERRGCTAIALGHWASERLALPSLAKRLAAALPGVATLVSTADHDPFKGL